MVILETTNYLDPKSFNKFLDAIPKIENFKPGKKAPMDSSKFILLFQITYFCALRISETLNLTKEDLQLGKRICIIRNAKTGQGKPQKTTIPPPLITLLDWNEAKPQEKLFNCTRQTVWKYAKLAGKLAMLEIAEEQKERSIEGIWTHIFRKSYSKWMQSKGASRELRMAKLRHAFKDAHDAYDAVDLNTLKAWENEAFSNE